jgi:Cu/Ag efflux pump CusA
VSAKSGEVQRLTRGLARWAQLLIVDTLSGAEGHIFGPMAKTYAYAIAGGLIAAFTITPALSARTLRLALMPAMRQTRLAAFGAYRHLIRSPRART